MSVPPKGAGPRGTLPLGIGFALPSPYAARHAEREYRETTRPPALGPCVLRQAPELPELPEWEGFDGPESEPAAVEPHRSAQCWGDVAKAPRAPALRAPVRLRGRWPAAGSILTALGAIGIAGLVVNMYALPELPELRQAPELHAAQTSPAPSTPEPAPPASPTSTAHAASTAHAVGTARSGQPAAPPSATSAIGPKSDVVDPWGHR